MSVRAATTRTKQGFAKRPAFGGRGDYRERKPSRQARAAATAGAEKGRRAHRQGGVARRPCLAPRCRGVDRAGPRRGQWPGDQFAGAGRHRARRHHRRRQPLPAPERTRLFLYHKPRGLMTTHADPEGRPTVFDNLPEGLPRLISIGRLDFNTEGLLLLTNDGGLARTLELPDTGWLRRYRVRAHGEVTQDQLDALKKGVEVDGVKYGSIEPRWSATRAPMSGWYSRSAKARTARCATCGASRPRGEPADPRLLRSVPARRIDEGQVEEVKTRVLREQLGEKIAGFGRRIRAPGAEDARAMRRRPRRQEAVQGYGKSAWSRTARAAACWCSAAAARRRARATSSRPGATARRNARNAAITASATSSRKR